MMALSAVLGVFFVIYGVVGGDKVYTAFGLAALAFSKASEAMLEHRKDDRGL